jgi:homoserine O-acetyltransferase
MQAMEWGLMYSSFVRSVVLLACGAQQEAWQIALDHVQKQAIEADPCYQNGNYDPVHQQPARGLALARQVAMISYRTPGAYHRKFGRQLIADRMDNHTTRTSTPSPNHLSTPSTSVLLLSRPSSPACTTSPLEYEVQSYLEHQGEKMVNRFDANAYIRILDMLESHDVGRGRGGVEKALKNMHIPTLIIGIESDVLYPPRQQKELHSSIPGSQLLIIDSDEGHDGFLLEQTQINAAIKNFLAANC